MSVTTSDALSAAHNKAGRLQRALLERLDVHEREGTIPTNGRFLFYELVQLGVVPKAATGKRRADQDTIDALTHLREVGAIPWDWIEDETRKLEEWQTAPTVAEYVADATRYATIDRWTEQQPAPLILCESRSLAGALRDIAALYACPIASTNGQNRGFLVSKVSPALQANQRVLYVGDWDHCGHQIEAATRRTLEEHSGAVGLLLRAAGLWERVALTDEQVAQLGDDVVIRKPDRRYEPVRYFDAVETEAFCQANIVAAVRARLDELVPEPIGGVLERQERQRTQVAEQLRGMSS